MERNLREVTYGDYFKRTKDLLGLRPLQVARSAGCRMATLSILFFRLASVVDDDLYYLARSNATGDRVKGMMSSSADL